MAAAKMPNDDTDFQDRHSHRPGVPLRMPDLARRLIRSVMASAETVSDKTSHDATEAPSTAPRSGALPIRQALFWDAPVAIAVVDPGGMVRRANDAFTTLIGAEPPSIGIRLTDCIALPHRLDGAEALTGTLMAVSQGSMPSAQLNGVTIRGRSAPMSPMVLSAHRLDGTSNARDVLIHVLPQVERRRFDGRLAQARSLQSIGRLAGGVAHDFNNMLTAMLGFTDLLLERHGPGDPSHADLQRVRDNAERSRDLVRQLLAFSRRQHLEPVILEVDAALASIEDMLTSLLTERVVLTLELDARSKCVRTDRTEFNRVLANLAMNARDAMPSGGTLTIRTRQTVVTERRTGPEIMPSGTYVVIDVIDTGSGIPEDLLEKIFEPFFSTKQAEARTGLGLATAHGIVRQSGGFIFVDSTPGRGSTFSIFLPAVRQRAETAGGVIPDLAPPRDDHGRATGPTVRPGAHILLVEDERAVRAFAARALRISGYDVTEAGDAEAALDFLRTTATPIDLMVSDVIMPGKDGYDLARAARRQGLARKVLFISGFAPDTLAPDLAAEGDVSFLAKPFTLADLAAKVRDMLA
ncbi:MAG: response regulator [Rhodospirillales bacterium]|nr:MAG: response regulator [Rhodospirillales bacterium]